MNVSVSHIDFMFEGMNEVLLKSFPIVYEHREGNIHPLMYHSLHLLNKECEVTELDERLIQSHISPYVSLVPKTPLFHPHSSLIPSLALRSPYPGVHVSSRTRCLPKKIAGDVMQLFHAH